MNPLKKQLQSENETERMYAIDDLSEKMNNPLFELFLERLKIEDSQLVKDKLVLQLEQAVAENKVQGIELYARVFALYFAHNAYLRSSAIQILSAGNNAVVDFLVTHYPDSNANIRKLILDTLVQIDTDKSKNTLRKALNDKDENVKITAVELLGNLKDTPSIPQLLSMLDTHDDMLRISIAYSIEKMGTMEQIQQVLTQLLPDNAIEKVSGLYLPSVVSLISKVGTASDLEAILHQKRLKKNCEDYQIELLHFLSTACNRFDDFIEQAIVRKIIFKLLKVQNRYEKTPFIIFSLFENSKNQALKEKLTAVYSSENIDNEQFNKDILLLLTQMLGV